MIKKYTNKFSFEEILIANHSPTISTRMDLKQTTLTEAKKEAQRNRKSNNTYLILYEGDKKVSSKHFGVWYKRSKRYLQHTKSEHEND